jgi:hypothetical protein
MKTRIAAALSLSGVLVAGSAAALVNTQVLTGDDSSGSGVSVVSVPTSLDTTVPSSSSVPTTDPTAPTTSLPGDTSTTVGSSLPDSSVPVTTGPATSTPASTQAIYNVGDAGTITLDTVGDVLTVVAATPKSGWTLYKIERKTPLKVEVKFRSGTVEVEFEASLLFGVIGTEVESRSLVAAPPSTGSVPGPGTTIDDDDDGYDDDDDGYDDDDEDDDHDDDHDDDDDDDDDDEDDD